MVIANGHVNLSWGFSEYVQINIYTLITFEGEEITQHTCDVMKILSGIDWIGFALINLH